jgi:hypothetical protein
MWQNIYFRYIAHSICMSSNSGVSKQLPDDGRLLPKHDGASIWNKGLVQSVHIFGHFYYSLTLCLVTHLPATASSGIVSPAYGLNDR